MPKAGHQGPVRHGTPAGYAMETQRGLPTCQACRAAIRDDNTARRIRCGQVFVRMPVDMAGLLLLTAGHAAKQRAVDALGPLTAAACIDRAPYLEEPDRA